MKRKILFLIGSIYSTFSFAQEFSGQYTAEWQWDMNKNTNWANLLRLDMNIPIGKGNDAFEAATIHVSKTNGSSDISSDKVSIKQKKTAEVFVYLNNHKQIYKNEQQFSISCMGPI